MDYVPSPTLPVSAFACHLFPPLPLAIASVLRKRQPKNITTFRVCLSGWGVGTVLKQCPPVCMWRPNIFSLSSRPHAIFFCRCSPQLIKKTDRIIFVSNATLSCFLYGSVQCMRPTSLVHKFTNWLMDGQSVGLINFNRASLSVYHCTAVTAAVQFRTKTAHFGQWRNSRLLLHTLRRIRPV